jgi:DNA-binding NarL/FixJ family response regulator
VRIVAQDPIVAVGLATILGAHTRIVPVQGAGGGQGDVALFAGGTLLASGMRRLHEVAELDLPIVLLAGGFGEASLLTLIECGVVAFLDRRSATQEEIVEAVISAAAGEGVMPKATLGKLMSLVQQMRGSSSPRTWMRP